MFNEKINGLWNLSWLAAVDPFEEYEGWIVCLWSSTGRKASKTEKKHNIDLKTNHSFIQAMRVEAIFNVHEQQLSEENRIVWNKRSHHKGFTQYSKAGEALHLITIVSP